MNDSAESKTRSLDDLREILDRLGPGAFLHIDERWMAHLFDFQKVGPNRKKGIDAAKAFAENRECAFHFEEETNFGVFGRAYFRDV